MASDFVEYEFTLPNGATRYEMIERSEAAVQVQMFMKMHGAVRARPVTDGA